MAQGPFSNLVLHIWLSSAFVPRYLITGFGNVHGRTDNQARSELRF